MRANSATLRSASRWSGEVGEHRSMRARQSLLVTALSSRSQSPDDILHKAPARSDRDAEFAVPVRYDAERQARWLGVRPVR